MRRRLIAGAITRWERSRRPAARIISSHKERYYMYPLKRQGVDWMYWNLMLRGKS